MKFYRKSSQQLAELNQEYSEKSWRLNLLQMNHISTRDVKDRRREMEQLTDETQSLEKQIKAIEKDIAATKLAEENKLFAGLAGVNEKVMPLKRKYTELVSKEHALNKLWNSQASHLEKLKTGASDPISSRSMENYVHLEVAMTKAKQDIISTYQELEVVRKERKAVEDELRKMESHIRIEYAKTINQDVNELASAIDKAYQIAEKIAKAQAKANRTMANTTTLMAYSVANPVYTHDLEAIQRRVKFFQESNAKLLQQ